MAAATVAVGDIRVERVTLAGSRLVAGAIEYDYRITLNNQGAGRRGVVAELVSTNAAGTNIVDGLASAGTVAAGATVVVGDLVTVRHTRSGILRFDAFTWRVSVAPPAVEGVAAVGAALANARVSVTDLAKTNVCAEDTVTTNGTGDFVCTVLEGKSAPFLVVVTEPFGAYPPMVSVIGSTPPAGTALVANATPLTTAIVAQLSPNGVVADVIANPALIDLAALARTTANVLQQIGPVLTLLGAPPGYDPFTTQLIAATPLRAGNTADAVIEALRFPVVGGVPMITTIDNPNGGVRLAGPNDVNPPVLPAPSPGVLSLARSLAVFTKAFNDCFVLPVPSRVLAVDTTIPSTAGGPKVTQMAAACEAIARAGYLHNGYAFGQRFYNALRDPNLVGASTFNLPEVMLYIEDPSPADNDRAVLNFRFVGRNGVAFNAIESVQKFPGIGTPERPTDWAMPGNQQPIDSAVRAFTRRHEQLVPNPGQPPFVNVGPSRYEAGIEMFVNKDGPGSIGLRAARIKGPGLPANGVVLTRPDPAIITDQTWLNIRNKSGNTDPAVATLSGNIGNVFRLHRTQGLSGAAAAGTQPNPNAGNSNNTAFPQWAHPLDYGAAPGTPTLSYINFAALGPHNVYTVEVFYDGELAPRHVIAKTMLTSVTPATFAVNLQWHALTAATRGYLDPASPLAAPQATMALAWTANLLAETVASAGVYTFGGGQAIADSVIGVTPGGTTATAVAPGPNFPALTNDGTSGRSIQLRHRMLDGSYKDSITTFN